MLSPDGRWWWDGSAWRAVAPPTPPDFRPTTGRAVLVCVLMGMAAGLIIANGAVALPFYLDLALPASVNDVLVLLFQLFGFLFEGAWIAAAVAFAVWLFGVVRNLPALGTGYYLSPVWAVLCLFIPFVNLFLPFAVLQQAWQAGEPEPDKDRPNASKRISLLIVCWWTGWLAFSPISLILYGYLLNYVIPPSKSGLNPWYINYPWMAFFAGMVALAIMVVLRLSRRQEARRRRLGAEAHDRSVAAAAPAAGVGREVLSRSSERSPASTSTMDQST